MSRSVRVPNGIISLVETEFNCPNCTCHHEEDDWYGKYRKAAGHVLYMNCKGCKTKLGITLDMRSDVVVWLKEEEEKI